MKIVVSGGGTGGHIYPALALIREIQKENKNAEVLYIGTQNEIWKVRLYQGRRFHLNPFI